jgi:hypothetical protein
MSFYFNKDVKGLVLFLTPTKKGKYVLLYGVRFSEDFSFSSQT